MVDIAIFLPKARDDHFRKRLRVGPGIVRMFFQYQRMVPTRAKFKLLAGRQKVRHFSQRVGGLHHRHQTRIVRNNVKSDIFLLPFFQAILDLLVIENGAMIVIG